MYELKVQNKYGQELDLSNNPNYTVTSIDGLEPPDATINTTKIATADGSVFNSAYLENRQIIITMAINYPAEQNRINLYNYFKAKFPMTVYYRNGERNVKINGYLQKLQIAFFDMKQTAQATIICNNPYFEDLFPKVTVISKVQSQFEFPFAIEEPIPFSTIVNNSVVDNQSDFEIGGVFTIHATDTISNPTIFNRTTNEFFAVNVTLNAGDEVVINTRTGEKSVYKILNGVKTNALNEVQIGSKWLQLAPQDNDFIFSFTGYYDACYCECEIVQLYEGV